MKQLRPALGLAVIAVLAVGCSALLTPDFENALGGWYAPTPSALAHQRGDARVSDRDVRVFHAVVRSGLIPAPEPGDPVEARTDVPAPLVVSQTLRFCSPPHNEVGCVPELLVVNVRRNNLAPAGEFEALMKANTGPRMVPGDLIRSIPHEQVFGSALSWDDVWSWGDGRKVPECVQFTAPAYGNGDALVYAQRLWKGRGYGWLVRLATDGSSWRVVTKTLVWRSHPAE